MLNNYGGEYPFRMEDLYDKLGLSSLEYQTWVKENLIESFKIGFDYCPVYSDSEVVNLSKIYQDYQITKRTAEELALLSRTPQGKILRNWLLDIKEKVQSNELLTLEQVYYLVDLVNVFSFVVHQKAAEEFHKETFVSDYIDNVGDVNLDKIYQEFHKRRNEILGISPKLMKERVLRFYDDEKRLVNRKTKRDVLAIIDKYALIGNAAFDFMSSMGKTPETANRIGGMVKRMASKIHIEIRYRNEPDLFNDEKNLNINILKFIHPFLDEPRLKSVG